MITPEEPTPADDSAWAPRGSGSGRSGEQLVAGYHDFTVIARGGDSVVYRARQDDLDRDVAVKVVLLDDPETQARFERELRITVRLGRQHPHIVTVLATGSTRHGQPCLVMDYYELGSLQDRLAERDALPVSDVVTAGSVVADALSFAHAQGVLHRDVKPQNVLVLPTSYVLADFGLARAIDAGHSSSLERFSYRHASPQVLDGEAPSTADDIYSLGSTLYTLLDGRPPFAADDPDEDSALSYLRRARTGEPRPLARHDVPPRLAEIVMRCLAKRPEDRFADAAGLRAALDAVPTESRNWSPEGPPGVPVDPPPAPPPPPVREPDAAFAPPGTSPQSAAPAAEAAPVVTIDLDPPAARPAPAPAEPGQRDTTPDAAPVAVSALAQLDRGAAAAPSAGDDATGLRPVEEPPGPPPMRPRRWPLLAAAGVVFLVIGVVLGLRNGGSGKPAAARSTSSVPLTSPVSAPVTTPSTSGFPTPSQLPSTRVTTASGNYVYDKKVAPIVTSVIRDGTKVRLAITDRTKGLAQLALVLPDGHPYPVPKGAPGVTLVDQPKGRTCYVVTGYAAGEKGTIHFGSTRACTKS